MDADRFREALVVAGRDRDDRLAGRQDLLGDRPREARVRIVAARAIARGLRFELAGLADEQDEAALGAEQGDGVIGDAREQARDVVLGGELAGDLEDPGEAVLGEARPREERGVAALAPGARTRSRARARAEAVDRRRRGDRRRVRLAQAAAPRVVPEDLAQVARQLGGRFLQRREGRLGVAPRRRRAALRGREAGARVERLPRPLLAALLAGAVHGEVEGAARRLLVARAHRDGPAEQLGQRPVLAEPRLAQTRADGLELAPERRRVLRDVARAHEQPLEARLGGVVRAALRFPRQRRLLVEAGRARRLAGAGRELRLEAEQLRPRPRREGRARGPVAELVDRAARPRPASEV